MNYNLEERTAKFGENVISLVKEVRVNGVNKSIIDQLVRSSTSVGANYMEANQASSKKDFKNKIRISQKESNETKHWLSMLAVSNGEFKERCQRLWKEAHELTLIFAKISSSCEIKN